MTFATAPPAGLTLTADLTAAVLSLTMSIDRSVPNGDYSRHVVVAGADGATYLIPFWVSVTGR